MFSVVIFLILNVYKYCDDYFSETTRQALLSELPEQLNVKEVLYSKVENFGFGIGPGSNETGISVFRLPKATAQTIEQTGLTFGTLPAPTGKDWHGRFFGWKETPVVITKNWNGHIEINQKVNMRQRNIEEYLNKYGFMIDVDSKRMQLSNDIINQNGNFYAYNRAGIIIVSPKYEVVIFAFAG